MIKIAIWKYMIDSDYLSAMVKVIRWTNNTSLKKDNSALGTSLLTQSLIEFVVTIYAMYGYVDCDN
jgi:hypothetical protein